MATVNLLIKPGKKDSLAEIYIRYRDAVNKVDLSARSGYRILPQYWSNKTHIVKQQNLFTDSYTEEDQNDLKNGLTQLKEVVLNGMARLTNSGKTIDRKNLLDLIDQHHGKQSRMAETLSQYFDRFIKEAESGMRLHQNKQKKEKYKPSTIKSMKGFVSQFDNFRGDRVFTFDSMTMDLYDDLVNFFINKGYSPNTIGRNIKYIKSMMRSAREEGLHNNQEIERRKFKTIREEVENIYLTEHELILISNLDLQDQKILDEARDIFLIGCYTLQRFSDYSRIRPEMIRKLSGGTKVIDLIQMKTGERVIIPIRTELDILLKKYDYSVPKTYEQKVNQRIKEVAKLAGIIEPIPVQKTRGGLQVKETKPKYQLIVTHTARRTGCTNLYLAGVPTLDIMKLSGHKSENEFLKYIKVTKEETAEKLAKTKYFNQPIIRIAK